MIDPYRITDFSRTDAELEEYWLFCLSVAGKKATMIADKIYQFLAPRVDTQSPFDYLRTLIDRGMLVEKMMEVRLGKYELLARAFEASVKDNGLDLRRAHVSDLETIPGVGPKTARYFIMHSRADAQVAVIDTHVVKFLKEIGHEVPKGVPTGKAYERLEALMMAAASASGMTAAQFDLAVWSHYASKGKEPLPWNTMAAAA